MPTKKKVLSEFCGCTEHDRRSKVQHIENLQASRLVGNLKFEFACVCVGGCAFVGPS